MYQSNENERKSWKLEPLNSDEIAKFLKAANDNNVSAKYLLALSTGMKKNELLHLKWSEINFNKEVIQLNGRDFNISSSIVDLLEKLRINHKNRETDYVFALENGEAPDTYVWDQETSELAEEAGIKKFFTFNVLRHSLIE